MEYRKMEIGELCNVVTDYVANGSFKSLADNVKYSNSGYAQVIRLVDYNNKYSLKDSIWVSKEGYDYLKKSKLYGGEIIITNVGANLGTVFIAPTLEHPMTLGPNAVMLKSKENDLYLYYWLISPEGRNKIKAIVTGSAMPKFNKTDLKKVKIPVPNLEVQEKIVHILANIDKKIELNNQINDNLLNILRNYFKKYCRDNVNENWKENKLEDIVSIRRGASPRPIQNFLSMEGINWLKIADVTGIGSPFIYNIKEKIIEEGKNKSVFIKQGTLVVSNSATPGIPKFIMVDTCVHDGWLVLSDYETKYKNYLYFLIEQIRDSLIKLANGSVFNNLKTDILKQYRFYNPDNDTLNKFNSIAEPMMNMINDKTLENIRLEELRDTLLPKLMNGEIDLDKIEI